MRVTAEFQVTAEASREGPPSAVGLLVPFDRPGRTSAGTLTVRAGAIDVPTGDRVGRVKLFRGHDRDRPVARMESIEAAEDGLRAVFRFGSTPDATAAAAELADGLRDAFSVELDDVTVEAGVVTGGTLTGAALLPVPAFEDARAALAAGDETDTDGVDDMDELTTMTATAERAETMPAPPAVAAGAARTRPRSYAMLLAERLQSARFDGGDAAVQAALADVTPVGNGAGNEEAGLRDMVADELWSGRTYVDKYTSMVSANPLTGTKVTGWGWKVKPTVGPYAGNKAEIPTNPATLEEMTAGVSRLAGGHDLDRIYLDLGEPAVIVSYWRELADSCAAQLDAARLASAVAAAGAGKPATSLGNALAQAVADVPDGTYAAVSSDLVAGVADLPTADLPAILAGDSPLFAQPSWTPFHAPGLADGTVIVGEAAAVKFYATTPPIRVEGVHIPNAGIDAAMYAYYGSLAGGDLSGRVQAYAVTGGAATGGGRGRK